MSPQAPASPDLLRRVIAPTPVGREELRDPQSGLSLPQRWLLAQLDGESALEVLSRRPGSPPAERLPRDASRLVALGLAVDMGEPGPPASVFGPSTVQAELDLPLDGPADQPPPSGWEMPKPAAGRKPVVLATLALALVGGGAAFMALQRGPANAAVSPGAAAGDAATPAQGARAAAGGTVGSAGPGVPGAAAPATAGGPATATAAAPTTGLAGLTAGPSLTAPADSPAPPAPGAATPARTAIAGQPPVQGAGLAPAAPVRTAATAGSTPGTAPSSGVRETVTPLRPAVAEAAALPPAAAPTAAPPTAAPTAATATPPATTAATTVAPPAARGPAGAAVVAPPGGTGAAGGAGAAPAANPVAVAPAAPAPAPAPAALRPQATVEPAFPREGYGLGQRAVVLQARLSIAPDGSVTQVNFASGSGANQRPFERAARNALLQWRFPPGQGERVYQTQLRFSEE